MTRVPPASASCPATSELTPWLSVAWGTGGSHALARGPGGSPHRPERWPVLRPPASQQRPPSPGAGLPGALSEPEGGAGAGWRRAGLQGARFVVSEEKLLSDGMLVEAREASDEDLLVVHTRRYLNELKVRGLGAASRGRGRSLEGLRSCPSAGAVCVCGPHREPGALGGWAPGMSWLLWGS